MQATKDDIIGHTLTRFLRSPPEALEPGDDNDYSGFFVAALELDHARVIKLPFLADPDEIEIASDSEVWLELEDDDSIHSHGQVIVSVSVSHPGHRVVLHLANDYFVWQDEDEGGMYFMVEHRGTMETNRRWMLEGLEPYFK